MEQPPKSFDDQQSSFLSRVLRDIEVRLNNTIEVAKNISLPGAIKTANLANGSVTQVKLATNVASNGPAFRAHHHLAVAQTLVANTSTVVQTIEELDTNNNYASNRFTPTVAGYYQINCTARVSSAATAAWTFVFKNGLNVGPLVIHGTYTGVAYNSPICICSGIVFMNGTTDFLEWGVFSSGGGALDNTVTSGNPWHWDGCLVRAA